MKEKIYFHEDGVCEACKVVDKKNSIDWNQREQDLMRLLDEHRSKDGSYDCIVPGRAVKTLCSLHISLNTNTA